MYGPIYIHIHTREIQMYMCIYMYDSNLTEVAARMQDCKEMGNEEEEAHAGQRVATVVVVVVVVVTVAVIVVVVVVTVATVTTTHALLSLLRDNSACVRMESHARADASPAPPDARMHPPLTPGPDGGLSDHLEFCHGRHYAHVSWSSASMDYLYSTTSRTGTVPAVTLTYT